MTEKSLLNVQLEQQIQRERGTNETVQGYMGHKDDRGVSSTTRVDHRTITSVYNSGSQGEH